MKRIDNNYEITIVINLKYTEKKNDHRQNCECACVYVQIKV